MRVLVLINLVLLISLNSLFAKIDPTTNSLLIPTQEKSIVLQVVGTMGKAESFELIDKRGTLIYSDLIENDKKRIKYNLQQLPDDRYTIKVSGEYLVEIHEISISNGEVKLTDTKTHHRPSIRNLNNRIVVNSLSQSEESI
ncbi:MAG: hypothetical protein AAFY71_28765, partial [Bacteroidota bacterium]